MKTLLLRPGYMIALASRMKGGIAYETTHEESQQDGSTLTQEWSSKKTVFDTEEFDRAVKVRGSALYQIRKLCVKTPFCLLCPEANEADLDAGVIIAKMLCDDFNASSTFTKIGLYVLKAKLLGDDEQTARAIAGEMRDLLTEMGQAIQKMDPVAIRESLTKANELSQMMVEEQQEKVSVAIELARSAAREITKTLKNKGSTAVKVVSDYKLQLLAVEEAKKVFLDFEEPEVLAVEDEAPGVQVRDLDLGEEELDKVETLSDNTASLDLT